MKLALRLATRHRRARRLLAAIALSSGVVLLHLIFLAATVFADDCKRDIRRAEDCLRTPGFAQGIATGAATVVTRPGRRSSRRAAGLGR